MNGLNITESGRRIVIDVKVVPGSSRTMIAGTLEGMLKVKVSAAPEKGKANRCLIDLLAVGLGVKKNMIEIISGKTSPIKQIAIEGVSAGDVAALVDGK